MLISIEVFPWTWFMFRMGRMGALVWLHITPFPGTMLVEGGIEQTIWQEGRRLRIRAMCSLHCLLTLWAACDQLPHPLVPIPAKVTSLEIRGGVLSGRRHDQTQFRRRLWLTQPPFVTPDAANQRPIVRCHLSSNSGLHAKRSPFQKVSSWEMIHRSCRKGSPRGQRVGPQIGCLDTFLSELWQEA